jgi:hypothetical protein
MPKGDRPAPERSFTYSASSIEFGLDTRWEDIRPSPITAPAPHVSPTRGGTLRWTDRIGGPTSSPAPHGAPAPPSKPVRAGTLRWSAAELARLREQSAACIPPPSAKPGPRPSESSSIATLAPAPNTELKSPVRGRTLQWTELRDALLVARRLESNDLPAPDGTAQDAKSGADLFDELPVDELLGSLAAASLVPRASLAAQSSQAAPREHVSSEPEIETEALPGDLVSAICAAIDEEPE